MDVNFVNADVLRVAPDEVLVIRMHGSVGPDEESLLVAFSDALDTIGLRDRAIIVWTDQDVELAVVKRDAA